MKKTIYKLAKFLLLVTIVTTSQQAFASQPWCSLGTYIPGDFYKDGVKLGDNPVKHNEEVNVKFQVLCDENHWTKATVEVTVTWVERYGFRNYVQLGETKTYHIKKQKDEKEFYVPISLDRDGDYFINTKTRLYHTSNKINPDKYVDIDTDSYFTAYSINGEVFYGTGDPIYKYLRREFIKEHSRAPIEERKVGGKDELEEIRYKLWLESSELYDELYDKKNNPIKKETKSSQNSGKNPPPKPKTIKKGDKLTIITKHFIENNITTPYYDGLVTVKYS